ncbi:MAG: YkgJ family cysteine cluster protein [Sedimentisphaerales bacterium]|nr:YkgJ family cysteine cluster protein [Sedimentisphaerales bacterium]
MLAEVAELYEWLDAQLRQDPDGAGRCEACGACCDFPAYDHRLFVTPPELIYLAARLNVSTLKPMLAGTCPYQQGRRCTVHGHRFAACRIFCCKGDSSFQSELSEATIKRLKAICERFEIAYRYQDLCAALNAEKLEARNPKSETKSEQKRQEPQTLAGGLS